MTEARRLSAADLERGYIALNCGCHAFVFRTALGMMVDVSMFEACPKQPDFWGVRLEHVEHALEAAGKT